MKRIIFFVLASVLAFSASGQTPTPTPVKFSDFTSETAPQSSDNIVGYRPGVSGSTSNRRYTLSTLWTGYFQAQADGRFQPLDSDLTSLAAASGTNVIYYRVGPGNWQPLTIGSGLTFNSVSGTLTATGSVGGSAVWGGVTGTLSAQTDLQAALNAKANTATTLAGYGIGDGQLHSTTLDAIAAITGNSVGYGRSSSGAPVAITFGTGLSYNTSTNTLSSISGGGNMSTSTYDGNGNGVVDSADSVAYANITGKPLVETALTTGFSISGGTTSKTATFNNTLTFAGTDSSTLNIGPGGTLGSAAFTAASAYEVPLSFTAPISRSVNTISIPSASVSVNGYLSSADWATFNGKENALTFNGGLTRSTNTVSIANTTVSPGTYGDSTHVAQVVIGADGRATSAANVSITAGSVGQTQETLTTFSTAGDTPTARTTGSNFHTAFVAVGAGSGTYTRTVSLNTTNTPATGNRIRVVATLPTSVNPTVEIRNSTSGGTLLASITNPSATADTVAREFEYNGTAWVLVGDTYTATKDLPTTATSAATDDYIPLSGATNGERKILGSNLGGTPGANSIANSQLAQMAAHTYKGNNTSSTANAADLTQTQLKAELTSAVRVVAGTTDTLTSTDASNIVSYTSASSTTVTVPTNATQAMANGTAIFIAADGAGTVTVSGAAGTTINGAGALVGGAGTLVKKSTDTWNLYTGATGGTGTVTHTAGALTANAIMVGNGAADTDILASLGTTSTVLHGNAAGRPTFGAVSLTTEVSGILPVANGGTNNAFFTVSGPTTSAKTYNFPNASANVLTDNAAVNVSQGGTNSATAAGARVNLTPATNAVSASAIDWSLAGTHSKTLGANTTFTFSSAVDGETIVVALTNTTSNWTVTWPGTVKWSGGTAPTQTVGAKTDIYTFVDVGGTVYGSFVQNF